jgi:hypothetical protein
MAELAEEVLDIRSRQVVKRFKAQCRVFRDNGGSELRFE